MSITSIIILQYLPFLSIVLSILFCLKLIDFKCIDNNNEFKSSLRTNINIIIILFTIVIPIVLIVMNKKISDRIESEKENNQNERFVSVNSANTNEVSATTNGESVNTNGESATTNGESATTNEVSATTNEVSVVSNNPGAVLVSQLETERSQFEYEKKAFEEAKKEVEEAKKKEEEEDASLEVESILSSGKSMTGLSILEQKKNQQKKIIELEINSSKNKLLSSLVKVNDELYENINTSTDLCDKIDNIKSNRDMIQENFLKGRIPEIVRENFVKGGVPFNNKERTINFKDSNLVKNLNGLATQNDRSGYDITGCRMVSSDEKSITKTYETLNGPPLATIDYNTLQKEFVGTPFYPLNN